MTYAELSESQARRSRHFAEAQTNAMSVYCDSERDLKELQAENAKLMELVRDIWRFTGAACKKYPRLFDPSAQGGQMVQPNAIDAFEQRMRELGIEVDE